MRNAFDEDGYAVQSHPRHGIDLTGVRVDAVSAADDQARQVVDAAGTEFGPGRPPMLSIQRIVLEQSWPAIQVNP